MKSKAGAAASPWERARVHEARPSSPDEGMLIEGVLRLQVAPPSHLAGLVDVRPDRDGAPERAQVGNRIGTVRSRRPEDRMIHRRPESPLRRDRCVSDNRACVVDPASGTVPAAEGAQVGDRVRVRSGRLGLPNDSMGHSRVGRGLAWYMFQMGYCPNQSMKLTQKSRVSALSQHITPLA